VENQILQQILSEVRDLKQGQTAMQADIEGLKQGQAETNKRLGGVENRLDTLETNFESLATTVNGIHYLVNEDFALLKSVDKKVENLANISETHEQKFQKLKML
jgi:archaellum component FlaC